MVSYAGRDRVKEDTQIAAWRTTATVPDDRPFGSAVSLAANLAAKIKIRVDSQAG